MIGFGDDMAPGENALIGTIVENAEARRIDDFVFQLELPKAAIFQQNRLPIDALRRTDAHRIPVIRVNAELVERTTRNAGKRCAAIEQRAQYDAVDLDLNMAR